MDKEPGTRSDLKLACSVADALVLQYYEEPDEQKPAVYSISLAGLTANADGLYLLSDLEQRLTERIAAYDQPLTSINPTVAKNTSLQAVIYDLQGQRKANTPQHPGIYIRDRQKVVIK